MVGSHFPILLKRYTVGVISEVFEQPILLFASLLLTEMLRLVGFSIGVRDQRELEATSSIYEKLRGVRLWEASTIDLALTE
ncbi:hypothetical protein [Nostoc sp.]|uniref:hypothetical protein n=1 Tax=Nostoc sp. TaxID=1180 RepID=UPI002FFA4C1E